MNQNPKKKLPNAPTKKQAVDIFLRAGITYRRIQTTINDIIREHRSIPQDSQVRAKQISEKEFEEVVETFGIPKGFEW
jgi:hypothetical protein